MTLVVTQYQAQTKTKKLSGITGRDRSLIQLIIKLSDGQSSTAVPIMTINSLGIVLYMVYVTLVVLRKKKNYWEYTNGGKHCQIQMLLLRGHIKTH